MILVRPDPGRFQVAGRRCRPAIRLPVPSRQHAGLSEFESLWRIRCGKPAIGLEYLVYVRDFTGAAYKHRGANPAHGDEVREFNPKTVMKVGEMSTRSSGLVLAIALGATQLFPLNVAIAQRVGTAAPTDGSVLPFPPVPSASVAAPRLRDSIHKRRPEPNHLRKDAPNVLIILMDDVGFGQASTFGGEVNTPTLSMLADQGISYNTFHTTSICSPTRAAF